MWFKKLFLCKPDKGRFCSAYIQVSIRQAKFW